MRGRISNDTVVIRVHKDFIEWKKRYESMLGRSISDRKMSQIYVKALEEKDRKYLRKMVNI